MFYARIRYAKCICRCSYSYQEGEHFVIDENYASGNSSGDDKFCVPISNSKQENTDDDI